MSSNEKYKNRFAHRKRNTKTRSIKAARRKTRRHRGGAPADAWRLIAEMMDHSDMKRMGKRKPVATPFSGSKSLKGGFKYFRDLYDKIKGEKDHRVLQIHSRMRFGFTLGVWVEEQDPEINQHWSQNYNHFVGNHILFYSVEHLEALALASNLDLNQILQIVGPATHKNDPLTLAIINIAFGDSFMHDSMPLNEVGRNIFEIYDATAKERYFDKDGNPIP